MLGARTHRRIYILLLILLGGTMVTSTWAANLIWVLLGANWLFEGGFQAKWERFRSSRLLHAFLALVAIHLLGMLWTHNLPNGLNEMRQLLPLLVVPLVALTSQPLRGRARQTVLALYAGTVLVVSVIGTVRMLSIPDLPYRDAIPYISHIRFALSCCMVIYLCVAAWRHASVPLRIALAVVVLWMLAFLLLLRSYTAIAILLVVTLVLALCYYRRWYYIAAWLAVVALLSAMVLRHVAEYYRPVPLASTTLKMHTVNGRPYEHACDRLMENGNYVNNYICSEELESEWNRRSHLALDAPTPNGYSVRPTLIRYLNALGLTKDSLGIAQLSADQVSEIEQGIANPVYIHGSVAKKMVYVMLFERECYIHTHAVKDFTMLQRLEFWTASMHIVARSPWIGVGTGDVDDQLASELQAMHSELSGKHPGVHNQYIYLLLAFGILGTFLVAFFFLRAAPALRRQSPLWLAWLLTILVSCLTECTLGTLAGILFSTYFLAFRDSRPDPSSLSKNDK